MPRFVRVAHRRGWEVELIGAEGTVDTVSHASRQEALDHAMALTPDWIEVGDIAGLDTAGQHHVWTTLRRQRDGSYAPSPLKWQGKNTS